MSRMLAQDSLFPFFFSKASCQGYKRYKKNNTRKKSKIGSQLEECLKLEKGLTYHLKALIQQQQQQQQHGLFSQISWGRLEMKPERNKFKVQAH